VIGGKRGVVGVDGVEGKIGGGGQFDDFRARRFQFVAERVMLGLGFDEVGGVVESEFLPSGGVV
jgi:hypothetical protein